MRALIISLLCLASAAAAARPDADLPPHDACVPAGIPTEEGFVTSADGTRVYYRKLGRGTPVAIYLHGGPGGTIYNGGCEMAPLARRHALILYDQRGGGRSELVSDPRRLTWLHHVADLDAVRRRFGSRRVALIGLSWGSALALLYADAHPNHVARLLLVAPMPLAKTPFDRERNEAIERAAGADLLRARSALQQQMRSASTDDQVVTLCRRILTETPLPYLADPANAQRRHLTGCDYPARVIRNRGIVARHTLDSLGDWDFRPALARVRAPVLIVEGALSAVPLSSPRGWAAAAPKGRLLLVPQAGHEVGMDQPESLLAAAESYLRGRSPRGALRPR